MIFSNKYELQRIDKINHMRKQGIEPYRKSLKDKMGAKEFINKFSNSPECRKDIIMIAGRVKFIRDMGKASFIKIIDDNAILQIYYSKDTLGDNAFEITRKYVDVGDIISIYGFAFFTKTGELTLNAAKIVFLTKAITPMPEKFHGLNDVELRYRKRYLDLISNPPIKEIFVKRSKIISLIRSFFEGEQFIEVETPMMHPIPGGANAKPFKTHYNALKEDRYLRIAPELYLKRLIVGGFNAIFEINRNFRNEGIDHSHNPEFTMIEFYWAYKDYTDLMKLTEDLFEFLLRNLNINSKIIYAEHKINLKPPFKNLTYIDALIKIGKIDKDIATNKEKIMKYLNDKKIAYEKNSTLGKLQSIAFDNFVENKLINPTFITHFPIDISPLARRSEENTNIAERFELYIAGKEIANGFNELNDPIDQHQRFLKQVAQKDKGDEEACYMDEDYVRAIAYAMPPTAGEGLGIDRLVMLLTNSNSIKDIILFPALKNKDIH